MLTTNRKRLILEELTSNGQVVAKSLSETFGVSEDTIRRDLREMAAEGLLLRVHGGAMPVSPTAVPLAERRTLSLDQKADLGRAGATLVGAGMTIFVDGGTTNMELIRNLPVDMRLTVITHSPTIAAALETKPQIDGVLIGGKLYRHSMVAVGALAAEAIARVRADLFFLGVTGVHARHGLTTGDMEEAAIKRRIMDRAGETVVLATSDKLGAVSPFEVAGLAEISTLVLPAAIDDSVAEQLAQAGVAVLRAG